MVGGCCVRCLRNEDKVCFLAELTLNPGLQRSTTTTYALDNR